MSCWMADPRRHRKMWCFLKSWWVPLWPRKAPKKHVSCWFFSVQSYGKHTNISICPHVSPIFNHIHPYSSIIIHRSKHIYPYNSFGKLHWAPPSPLDPRLVNSVWHFANDGRGAGIRRDSQGAFRLDQPQGWVCGAPWCPREIENAKPSWDSQSTKFHLGGSMVDIPKYFSWRW